MLSHQIRWITRVITHSIFYRVPTFTHTHLNGRQIMLHGLLTVLKFTDKRVPIFKLWNKAQNLWWTSGTRHIPIGRGCLRCKRTSRFRLLRLGEVLHLYPGKEIMAQATTFLPHGHTLTIGTPQDGKKAHTFNGVTGAILLQQMQLLPIPKLILCLTDAVNLGYTDVKSLALPQESEMGRSHGSRKNFRPGIRRNNCKF